MEVKNHKLAQILRNQLANLFCFEGPTVITKSPQDQTVNVTDDVTLQCDVTTDAAEMEQLKVFWKKNEDRIDFARDDRLQLDPVDHSLIIRSAEIDDTAVYTCHADNGLDAASSEAAILTVKGSFLPSAASA